MRWGRVSPESGDAVLVTALVFEFNRRESPTQTRADAIKRGVSMETWGLPAQYSIIASVKAYRELKCPLAEVRSRRGGMTVAPALSAGPAGMWQSLSPNFLTYSRRPLS